MIDQTFQSAVDHRDSFFTPWTLSILHKWPLITPVLLTHTSTSVTVSKARGNPRIPVSQLPSGFILIQCLYPSVIHGAAFPFSFFLFISFSSSSERLQHSNTIDKKGNLAPECHLSAYSADVPIFFPLIGCDPPYLYLSPAVE